MGPYRARLTAADAAQGMKLARENAASLAAEARLLHEGGFHARSAALAILAIEEMGKIPVLRNILTAPDSESLRECWKEYRGHEAKNWMALFFRYARPGAHIEDLRPLVEATEDHAEVERIKQQALYSDKDSDGRWSDPSTSVDAATVGSLLLAAEFVCSTPGAFETVEELELWQEFIGPTHGKGFRAMKAALIECAREGKRRGLLEGLADGFEEFLGAQSP